jgi:hypothetical protein
MADFDRTYWMVEVTRGTVHNEWFVQRVWYHEALIHAEKAEKQGYANIKIMTQADYDAACKQRRNDQHATRVSKSEEAAHRGKAHKGRPDRPGA